MLHNVPVIVAGPKKAQKTNHLWIFDRSHSMHWTIKALVQDMIEHRKVLNQGDTLSIGWFSTEGGRFDWLTKGHVVSEDSANAIERLLKANATTIGLTCFSEILISLAGVVKDTAVFGGQVNVLHFFTDGYPVVSNERLEEEAIMKALTQVAPSLSSALFIGYGDYYNKELLSKMAAMVSGAVVHASVLETYSAEARISSQSASPLHEVNVPPYSVSAFYIHKGQITRVQIGDTDTVMVPTHVKDVWVDDGAAVKEVADDVLPGVYAQTILKLQQGRQDEAIEVLAPTGDIALIDTVTNAFTIEELGASESALRDAIKYPARRFLHGRNTSYVPDPNAACLVDVLEALALNDSTLFYPHDPRFVYKRTGVPSLPMEGYPQFVRSDPNPGVDFQVERAKTRANVNLQARVKGVVHIGPNDVGLAENYYTHRFREYVIIKDGVLHTTSIAISTTRQNYDWLKSLGVVDNGQSWKKGQPYAVNFAGMPMINRAFVSKYSDIQQLEKNVMLEIEKMAALKVYKALLKGLQAEKPFEGLSQAQADFLRSKGIEPYGYSPPSVKSDAEDFYYAKTFEVKVAGLSSLPSLADVYKKKASGKPFTKGQELMNRYIEEYEAAIPTGTPDAARIEWLNNAIAGQEMMLKLVRSYIMRVMFSVVVGKMWFAELGQTRDGATYNELVFTLDNVKVGY